MAPAVSVTRFLHSLRELVTSESSTVSAPARDRFHKSAGPGSLRQTRSSTSLICSFTCWTEGGAQGEGQIWACVIHLIWGLGRRGDTSCARDFLRWQGSHEVLFSSQYCSSCQALSGLSRAVTPYIQLRWQMLIVVPPVSEIYAVLLFIIQAVLLLDVSVKWW